MNKTWKIRLVVFIKKLIGYKEENSSVSGFLRNYDIKIKEDEYKAYICHSYVEISDGYFKFEQRDEVIEEAKNRVAHCIGEKLLRWGAIEFTSEHVDNMTLYKGSIKFLKQ